MITKAAILFLFGTSITSGQFWPSMAPYGAFIATSKTTGCPSGPVMAPLICKFMQANMGEFKPQLIAPTTYIAPMVVEKCDSPQLQINMEMPEPVEEAKPLVIPEPPQLPPMTIPKFPVPVIIEEPPAPLHEPCESADIQVMPVVNIPAAPELHELPQLAAVPESTFYEDKFPEIIDNTIEYHPISVPQPPELPAFVMPEIPIHVVENEVPVPVAPCLEDEPIPAPVPAPIEPLGPLPAAPKLPPFTMPELPIQMVEEPLPAPIPAPIESVAPLPAAPELPAFTMPELPIQILEVSMPVTPCLEDEPIPAPIPARVEPLAPLPAAPELPAFTMPELPIQRVEVHMPVAPCLEDEPIPAPIPARVEPLAPLPAAPELPAFTIPELPIQMVEVHMPVAPCLEDESIPAPIPARVEPLAPLPAAPELPAFTMPELPIQMVEMHMPVVPCLEDESIPSPIPARVEPLAPLPAAPELPAFTMPELPIQMAEVHMPVAPCLEDEPIPAPIPARVEPLAPLPAAPELPAFTMPELPIHVVDQESHMPAAPCFGDQPSLLPKPMQVPHFPELPAFVMPELPVFTAEHQLPMPAAPSHEDFPAPIVAVPEYIEPLAPMPAAPQLPPASLPEFAIRMDVPSAPAFITEPQPCLNEEKTVGPIIIAEPPKVHEIKMPEVPVRVAIEEPAPCEPTFMTASPFYQKLFPSLITMNEPKAKGTQNVLLAPMVGAYPKPCVYNLVMEHVVPNMLPNNFRSMKNIEIQPSPLPPC